MRISDWSSDVCSSDLSDRRSAGRTLGFGEVEEERLRRSSKGIYHFEIAVERRSVTVPQRSASSDKRCARQQLIARNARGLRDHDAGGTRPATVVAKRSRAAPQFPARDQLV